MNQQEAKDKLDEFFNLEPGITYVRPQRILVPRYVLVLLITGYILMAIGTIGQLILDHT